MQEILTSEMLEVIKKSAFVPIVTLSSDGSPHLIVVGQAKEIRDGNTIIFGVYKMEKTRKNLSETATMQVAAVLGKKGYRFSGMGTIDGERIHFTVESADLLL